MTNLTPYSLLLLLLCLVFVGSAQSVLINDVGGTPDGSAILEVRSDSLGVLVPRMISNNRLAIASPAKGLLVYQTNGVQGFYYYDGVAWDTLDGNSVINQVTSVNNTRIAIVQDVKLPGTDGGDFYSGSWVTRDLNTLLGDTSFISINGSTNFSLDSGLYEVNISAPARRVDEHQIRLVNVDAGSVVGLGTAVNSASASTTSELYIVFKIEQTTTFEVQHQCTTDNSDPTAKGYGIAWGNCIYTQVRVQQFN